MILKRNSVARMAPKPAVKINIHLSLDNRRKFATFIILLDAIDKRINRKETKTKYTKIKEGWQHREPFPSSLQLRRTCLFLFFFALSLSNQYCHHTYLMKHMIDTVILLLSKDAFQITDPDKFVPSARWITKSSLSAVHGIQSKQNPTKKELRAGIYKPRLTLAHRTNLRGTQEIILRIELSLPKLFFGNNFNELQYKDFPQLMHKLSNSLKEMGVIASADTLAHAPVSAIHYSKNIPLTDGSTPYHYINKIKEANIKLFLDVNQTDYRNEGHSYKWHCNSYEVVFYDKIKDLEKAKRSEKRAIEKDNALQLKLFDKFARRNPALYDDYCISR